MEFGGDIEFHDKKISHKIESEHTEPSEVDGFK